MLIQSKSDLGGIPKDIKEVLIPLAKKYARTHYSWCKSPEGCYSIIVGRMLPKETAMKSFSMDSHLPAFVFRFECRICHAQIAPPEAEGEFWGMGVLRSKMGGIC